MFDDTFEPATFHFLLSTCSQNISIFLHASSPNNILDTYTQYSTIRVDITLEMEQWAYQAAPARAAHFTIPVRHPILAVHISKST